MSLSNPDSAIPTGSVLLHDRRSYPTWFLQLQFHCKIRGIWQQVDPEAEDYLNPLNELPKYHSIESLIVKRTSELQTKYVQELDKWLRLPIDQRPDKPQQPLPLDKEEMQKEFDAQMQQWNTSSALTTMISNRHHEVWDWVSLTVDASVLASALVKLEVLGKGDASLQKVVRALRDHLAPSKSSVQTRAAEEYRAALAKARSGGIGHIL